jgi:transposase InsO family protein
MSDDSHRRDDERAILIALFRYGVIAPLVEQEEFAPGEITALVQSISELTHFLPGRGPVSVKERTLYDWLRTYRLGGIEALRPKLRKDRGTSRVMDDAIIQRAVQLRRENTKRWTSTLLDIMKREGTFEDAPIPHRSTLDRHLDRLGASRRMMGILKTKHHIKMQFDDFGDLWVGDYHSGPLILGPDGKPTTSKLGAFLDHATRYPVADRYYSSEQLATLRDTLLRAFLKWGKPKKAYVDGGAVYRAEQLKYSLKRVDTLLIHSRPYYSEGRGLIEKWWQVIKQFEEEVRLYDRLLPLHELNRLWEAYRELRYCQEIHSELGMSPNEAIADVTPRPIDPQVARELFLVKAVRSVGKKDACVPVEGRRFQCDSFLRGRTVEVRYDPNDLSEVIVFFDGRRIQKALPQVPNMPPEPHPEPIEKVRQSIDYLAIVREDYDKQLLEHARPLAYATLTCEPGFDKERFIEVFTQLAGIKLRPADTKELEVFWESYGPMPEELVRIGVEHAVRMNGRGRHRQVYLHALRMLVLAHWRNPDTNGKESS